MKNFSYAKNNIKNIFLFINPPNMKLKNLYIMLKNIPE